MANFSLYAESYTPIAMLPPSARSCWSPPSNKHGERARGYNQSSPFWQSLNLFSTLKWRNLFCTFYIMQQRHRRSPSSTQARPGRKRGVTRCHCLSQRGCDFAALDVYLASIQKHAIPSILQSAFILLALLAGRPLWRLRLKRLPAWRWLRRL